MLQHRTAPDRKWLKMPVVDAEAESKQILSPLSTLTTGNVIRYSLEINSLLFLCFIC